MLVSGRDLFTYQPDLFRDDEEAMEVDYTTREDEGQEDPAENFGVKDESIFLEEDLDNLEIGEEDEEGEEGEREQKRTKWVSLLNASLTPKRQKGSVSKEVGWSAIRVSEPRRQQRAVFLDPVED